ncbi:hypothetical protein H6G76_00425 [Nostoc sp. FACHB-152]|uniref:hypothetical protein n=1 Tax=unclassified Nostoc TaxID=2593658 RepID=UPI0016887014|nr:MULTISPECIES: hypothetical protein [unclassified Nostoc]MBD2445637.1 hypothetical protein [Nostoc sp. FACHB-152]MBD2466750.1 hypothetical protein [Nostoc sp. FACHB-145]
MLNNISKFLSPSKLAFPIVGLVLTIGVVTEQTNPVLSKQLRTVSTSASLNGNFSRLTNQQLNSSDNSLLSRLREIREQRTQQQTVALETDVEAESTDLLPVNYQKAGKEAGVMSKRTIPKKDGIYLYGQSPTANEIGQGYIIFKKQQSRVIGALYMPSSEFSCFQGTIDKSGELAMTVNGSQDEVGSSEVATTSTIPSVSDDDFSNYAHSVALQDYHPIKSIGASDRRILQMCQANQL